MIAKRNKKLKNCFLSYVLGVFLSREKSCVGISRCLGKIHDSFYRLLSSFGTFSEIISNRQTVSIVENNKRRSGYLIVDDTLISKPFAKFIQGLSFCYNVITNKSNMGINIVVVAWSNGIVTIPISFKWLIPKELAGKSYKPKSELAAELLKPLIGKIPFKGVLMDAHYTTLFLINFLVEKKLFFVGKIAKNRSIKSKNSNSYQLRYHPNLQLLRNRRRKILFAEYAGNKLYFSIHKRKNKLGNWTFTYLVSNKKLNAAEYLDVYDNRWEIEIMFRTMKQSMGLARCQSRKIEIQSSHLEAIFFGYCFLQEIKQREDLEKTQDAIRYVSELKFNHAMLRINSFNRNFECIA